MSGLQNPDIGKFHDITPDDSFSKRVSGSVLAFLLLPRKCRLFNIAVEVIIEMLLPRQCRLFNIAVEVIIENNKL